MIRMSRIALVVFQTLILLTLAEGAARMTEWLRPLSNDLASDYAPNRMRRGLRYHHWEARDATIETTMEAERKISWAH